MASANCPSVFLAYRAVVFKDSCPSKDDKPHQITGIVFQILVSHRVAKQVRVQLEAADRTVLVAQGPEATVGQRSPFADEHPTRLNGWAGFEISSKGLAGRQCQRHGPLLVALAISKDHRTASLTNHQIMEVQIHEIADSDNPYTT